MVDIIELATEFDADLNDTDRSLIGSDEVMLAPMANSFRIGLRDQRQSKTFRADCAPGGVADGANACPYPRSSGM